LRGSNRTDGGRLDKIPSRGKAGGCPDDLPALVLVAAGYQDHDRAFLAADAAPPAT
jgi:hypothetical protein